MPKTIDSGAATPRRGVLVNLAAAAGLFAVQHSVMARRGVQALVDAHRAAGGRAQHLRARRDPRARAAAVAWRPIAEPVIWRVENPAARHGRCGRCSGSAGRCCCSHTFLINHFELFGLRQVFSRLVGREIPEAEFRTPFIYRYVRHPIYLGFLLGFWAAPVMTAGHLLFAIGATGYILVGIWFEERDLIAQFGDRYRRYRKPGRDAASLPQSSINRRPP